MGRLDPPGGERLRQDDWLIALSQPFGAAELKLSYGQLGALKQLGAGADGRTSAPANGCWAAATGCPRPRRHSPTTPGSATTPRPAPTFPSTRSTTKPSARPRPRSAPVRTRRPWAWGSASCSENLSPICCAPAGWIEMGVETELSAHVPPVHSASSTVFALSRLSSRDRKQVLSPCVFARTAEGSSLAQAGAQGLDRVAHFRRLDIATRRHRVDRQRRQVPFRQQPQQAAIGQFLPDLRLRLHRHPMPASTN